MFDDGHAVERFLTLGGLGFFVMFLEMGNVFGMGQIFFARIYFEVCLRLAIACPLYSKKNKGWHDSGFSNLHSS